MKIVIVDTECANLTSVKFAIERLGYQPVITDDEAIIGAADRVILPGVGTAAAAMRNLQRKQLIEPIKALTQPTLGIWLLGHVAFDFWVLGTGESPQWRIATTLGATPYTPLRETHI